MPFTTRLNMPVSKFEFRSSLRAVPTVIYLYYVGYYFRILLKLDIGTKGSRCSGAGFDITINLTLTASGAGAYTGLQTAA